MSTGTTNAPEKVAEKQYVILRSTPHWEVEVDDKPFILSITQTDAKPFAKYHKNLKASLKERIRHAVHLGLLDFTNDPENYKIGAIERNDSKDKSPRYATEEFSRSDVKENRRVPNAPQVSNRNMTVKNADPKAAKLLLFPAHQVVAKLPDWLAQRDDNSKRAFLRDLYKLESRGMNPSFQPRRAVIDALDEEMLKMGLNPAPVSAVMTEDDDPDIPDKVTRIAL